MLLVLAVLVRSGLPVLPVLVTVLVLVALVLCVLFVLADVVLAVLVLAEAACALKRLAVPTRASSSSGPSIETRGAP